MTMAALGAIGSALGGVGSMLSQQSHSPAAQVQRHVDTSTAAIAAAGHDKKLRRELAKNAREERLVAILTDPQVMGALVTIGGLVASSRIPFHPDPVTNARLRGVSAASCVLMGLGRAGVGDMTTLAFAAAAGVTLGASGGSGIDNLFPTIPGTDIPAYALTPAGGTVWAIKELAERVNK